MRVPLQLAAAAILLALLWRANGGAALLSRLAGAQPLWVAAGVVFGTAAMFFAALRWRYTAHCVGLDMTVRRSLREFYLAVFVNSVLPAMSGDALRAWRHGKRSAVDERGGVGPAVRAVIIERMANQVTVSLCVLASMSLWPWMPGAFAGARLWVPVVGVLAVIGGSLGGLALFARRRGGGAVERFVRDSRQALVGVRPLLSQLGLGLLITGSCAGMFACAALALDAPLSVFHIAALVPGTLYAMSIPISIGGWGVREAAAVVLWSMAGLPAADGMATSVLHGVLVLLSALPGAVMLAADR